MCVCVWLWVSECVCGCVWGETMQLGALLTPPTFLPRPHSGSTSSVCREVTAGHQERGRPPEGLCPPHTPHHGAHHDRLSGVGV